MIIRALQAHAAFRFMTLLLAIGFQILVVKVLTPENYATYAVLLATLLVGERLLSFGIDRTVLRFIPGLVLRQDRRGLKALAIRLALTRTAGLLLFSLAFWASSTLTLWAAPTPVSTTTLFAFAVWFVALTFMSDANAVAQSLIAHRTAAIVAASEAFVRTVGLSLIFLAARTVSVETVAVVSASTSSAAVAGLVLSIVLSARRTRPAGAGVVSPDTRPAAAQSQISAFAMAAYASTISYLISSPGVIRLVATTGLDIVALAAFSFLQSLCMALQRALPGNLILPSLEPVAAQMAESGHREKILPALSLLFKFELTCVLAMIIALASAGALVVGTLSRPAYAPYYYMLPILMVGLLLGTVYRILETLGSMNLTFKIFLSMWPLSVIAMATLYLTVGTWGLISVLAVPIAEIVVRVGILIFAFRNHGVRRALDPVRSLRIVALALLVLLCSWYVRSRFGADLDRTGLLVAATASMIFLASVLFIRPLSAPEYESLWKVLPASWRSRPYVARILLRP